MRSVVVHFLGASLKKGRKETKKRWFTVAAYVASRRARFDKNEKIF